MLSTAFMGAYLLTGYFWFNSSSAWVPLSVLYMPFTMAFAAGYSSGEGAGWMVHIACLAGLWWFVHTLMRSFVKERGANSVDRE